MRSFKTRLGMALPFTIIAMVVVVGFIMTMSRMNQGVKNQIFHTNNHQLSFLMAYSALSRVCAKIHSFSWANRPFVTDPLVENKVALQGGEYDLLVENSKNRDFQADVYVRTHLAGISRMYFWRVRFNDDLLDVSNQIFVEAFLNADPKDFPVAGKANPFASRVESMLAQRVANQKKSDQLAREIIKLKKPNDIIKEINGRPIAPGDPGFPPPPEDIEIAKKEPVDVPQMPPLPGSEKPSAPGPRVNVPPSATDSMVGINMNAKMASVVSSSKSAYDYTDQGWKKIEEKGVGGMSEATDLHTQAAEAREKAFDDMSDLITDARTGINDAPSSGAAKAIEEMVSQTIVAGVQNLGNALNRGMDHLDNNAGSDYLNSLPTAESVAKLTTDWETALVNVTADVTRMTELANEIGPFAKAPEVEAALAAALEQARANVEQLTKLVEDAKKRLEELIKKEEEEAERLRQQENESQQ
ncbi:MAG TPA: hypothetical protein PLM07_20055 [Candidatus Rifleibacterium sp.]|nr:hypothetical protein [Candidatus Rifleibacterium sp.]HPT48183.1 hypothetical protein [Candidatus Rifleibacterium sp.]